VYTAAEAQTLVNAASLIPGNLSGAFVVQSDTPANLSTDPAAATCGKLAGRTVFNLAVDPVGAFIGGQTLAFFSNATAYATDEGAIDCSQRAAARFTNAAEIARAFGTLFVNPDAVVGTVIEYPQTADGSFAGTLTGQVNASGTVIEVTLLIVTFRKGNVTVVIGSARSGTIPPAAELSPLVNLVVGRITANQ
jgi:hypothetical protein